MSIKKELPNIFLFRFSPLFALPRSQTIECWGENLYSARLFCLLNKITGYKRFHYICKSHSDRKGGGGRICHFLRFCLIDFHCFLSTSF